MQAIRENDLDNRFRWFTFWLLLGGLTHFDPLLRFLLSFMPLYYLLKLCLYVALMHPQTDWAMLLFTRFLKPFVVKVDPIRRES